MAGKPGKTILLVDDDAIIAIAEAQMLAKHGYNVISAFSGQEAIKTAVQQPDIDLILMDIDLGPGMDGTQAAETILKTLDIPVLFLSSHTEPEVVDKTEKITSYGYVVKNSGETVLLASIRMAFKLHAAHRELRKREEALSKSENKLSLIFENTPNAITITEAETGIVIDANRGIEWTGWTRNEVIGKSLKILQSWIRPDEEEIIKTIIQSEGKLSNHRFDFYKKDGSPAHALMNAMFIQMDGKQYLLTISNDITRLVESEEKLRRTKEEMEGTNEELNATVEELEATNEEFQVTNEELVESKNELETLLAEHKRVLQILRENEYFLEKSQEIGKIGSFITEIISLNPTTIQWRTSKVLGDLIGVDATYLKTRENWLNLILDPQAVIDYVKGQIVEKKEKFELEYQIRRPGDGEIRWIYSIGEPKFDDKGTIKSIIGTAQDITDRKRSEQILRDSENRYRSIIGSLPIGMHLYRLEPDGRLVFEGANPAADRILGVDNSIFIGKVIEEAFPALSATDVPRRYREVAATGTPWHNEQVDYDENSIRGAFEVHAFQIGDRRMATVFSDITERKRSVEDVKRLAEIVRHSSELVNLADMDGRMIFINESGLKMLGIAPEDVGKINILQVIPDHLKNLVKKEVIPSLLAGRDWEGDLQYVNLLTGELTDVHALTFIIDDPETGHHKYLANVSLDISLRTQTEMKLRESEARWQFALEGSGDGVWDWNTQTDRVFFSHQWKKMLGYEDQEIGDSLSEWDRRVHPDDHDRVFAEINRHLEGTTPMYMSEHRVKCKNGEYRWILDRGKVISRTPEGKPLRVIGTHTDITDRKNNEEVLGKAIAEKEALLRELQHRMKNSLALISGIMNLERDRLNNSEWCGILDNIRGRVESLSSLYSLLFQSDSVQEVDLGMYMRSIVTLLSGSYTAGVPIIKIKQHYDPLRVNAKDAAAWGLILNELLTNSFKYAFPKGRAGSISVNLKKSRGQIMLAVSDNGTGLPADFSTENPHGLGLLLVKTLTLQLKGTLDFEDGNENTFMIRVPIGSAD